MLPNKPRGVPRVDDRRVLNGIFWRRAGIWHRIMNGLATAHDAAVQMIDTSIVRVHQHGACIAENRQQHMGRSRGRLTSKVHAVVDANGLPVRLGLASGEAHDNRLCSVLLAGLRPQTIVLADRGYDADWISDQGAWANVLPKKNRKNSIDFSADLYRSRNLVERFSNKIKQCRRIATRYDKLAAKYLAFIKLASIRLWIRTYESTPWSGLPVGKSACPVEPPSAIIGGEAAIIGRDTPCGR